MFNEAAKKFETRLSSLGFPALCPSGFGNDQDVDKYDTKFEEWAPSLWDALQVARETQINGPTVRKVVKQIGKAPASVSQVAFPLIPRRSTFELEVISNRQITPENYDRKISHITLRETSESAGDLSYGLGDALSVYPRNDPARVAHFLDALRIDKNQGILVDKIFGLENSPITVFELFAQYLDILGKSSGSFYKRLSDVLDNGSSAKTKLLSIATRPEVVAERVQRGVTIADTIMEFFPKIDLDRMVAIVPTIKPRMYSIASSYRALNGQVDLLVVQHEWDSDTRRMTGICSKYINDLKPGDRIVAGVGAGTFSLPKSHSVPMVMAGLGTGLAPFRSFIQERAVAMNNGEQVGELMLFYGCRHKDKDFAFGQELEEFARQNVITTLAPAFSRDQEEKIYIQQRIRENAEGVYNSLVRDQGYFYLCGQAGHMATQVEDALADALSTGGGISLDEARNEIQNMKNQKRFSTELY
jgi:sulfite reductase alpha subunit-like flavoprotein